MNNRKSKIISVAVGLFLFFTNAFATNKIHLVSVGIADYPGVANDLTLPAKDAATVKWLYEKTQMQ